MPRTYKKKIKKKGLVPIVPVPTYVHTACIHIHMLFFFISTPACFSYFSQGNITYNIKKCGNLYFPAWDCGKKARRGDGCSSRPSINEAVGGGANFVLPFSRQPLIKDTTHLLCIPISQNITEIGERQTRNCGDSRVA